MILVVDVDRGHARAAPLQRERDRTVRGTHIEGPHAA